MAGSVYHKHMGTIRCPGCHKAGHLEWEEVAGKKTFVRIEGEFYERLSKKPPFHIELVCTGCGKAQPGLLQP